jgi:hypothetical protein
LIDPGYWSFKRINESLCPLAITLNLVQSLVNKIKLITLSRVGAETAYAGATAPYVGAAAAYAGTRKIKLTHPSYAGDWANFGNYDLVDLFNFDDI